MKRLKYSFRKYKYDIVATVFAAASAIGTFRYTEDPRRALLVSLGAMFLSLAIIVYSRTTEKDFYFVSLKRRSDKDEWIGSGKFEYTRTYGCFVVTRADPGYIYSKCLNWSDYRFSFEFKVLTFGGRDHAGLGVIVRAVNLSNYAMLQVTRKGIRPHIRINGGWSVQKDQAADLTFEEELALDRYYRCMIECENESVNVKLYHGGKELFNRAWHIRQGGVVFQYRRDDATAPVEIPFPIILEYGSVGFRNHGDESAIVKNVLVEKL